MGIELPGQLTGVQGASPLGGSKGNSLAGIELGGQLAEVQGATPLGGSEGNALAGSRGSAPEEKMQNAFEIVCPLERPFMCSNEEHFGSRSLTSL